MARTAFVTGASGFIGVNLVKQLIERGWDVTALYRNEDNSACLQRFPVKLVKGDVIDYSSIHNAMPAQPGAVFHVAGDTSFWSKNNKRQTKVNTEGTRNVVNAALQKKAKCFIHTSSIEAWGEARGTIDENTPQLGNISNINYCRTKWAGEKEALLAMDEMKVVVMNPGAVLGPYDAHTWGRTFFLLRDNKFPFNTPGLLCFAHVDEVVKAHINAVDHGENGSNYLLGGENRPIADFAREVAKLIGKKAPPVGPAFVIKALAALLTAVSYITGKEPPLTIELAQATTRRNVYYSSEKAVRELDFKIVPLEKCVWDCYNWLKEEKLL
ncbi:MAG: NAD-dependent epimerase/dehydratase family protein [Chitinophagaceae bacterium]|nr:NAD-dependent epimerase/dehydratase family protein [Chitinophagaceae bacterium]